MKATNTRRSAAEFGDFQTPCELAADVCRFLGDRGISPASVVEPTCGLGRFLLAAMDRFPTADCLGLEINPSHMRQFAAALNEREDGRRCRLEHGSFFEVDWRAKFEEMKEPILVIGNPPWVTNAQLGRLGSLNLPEKTNFQGRMGLDARTGKSNFDISEWMLIRLLEALAGRRAWIAMLCKTAVARKALSHAWKTGIALDWAEMRGVQARTHFGAEVDACLLAVAIAPGGSCLDGRVFHDLDAAEASRVIGWRAGQLVASATAHERWKHLAGEGPYRWRSGIKHDCARVMELRKEPGGYRNGLRELTELEDDHVFPMLKSSELANGHPPTRWMLVPQCEVGEDTEAIRGRAPKTWTYLVEHGAELDRRGSSIYRGRPRFSVFGVGAYTFAPWKVAISGFYKRMKFAVVGSSHGKPTVLDDTSYFVACRSEQEAEFLAGLLNSDVAREFYSAFLFWDAKRPITVDLLRRLDARALAAALGVRDKLDWLMDASPRGLALDALGRPEHNPGH